MSAEQHWPAPFRGANPVSATITIPGSKSATNRALILAALAESPSTLRKPLHSRDSALMIAGLKAIGCGIEELSNGDLVITPGKFFGPASVDVGNAGTVMRFLPPVAALANGLVHFDGDPRSHERPLGPVIQALENLGVSIEHGSRYSLPLTINGSGKLKGGELEIDASSSSQFISALLLIGPATEVGITVRHVGKSLPSAPHIDMTIQMLREFGATVEVADLASGIHQWKVLPGKLTGLDLTIEPDLSNAAPFMSAAMICGGEVTIQDWPKSTIAAVAALADTPSSLRGIGHLRLHETDRLAALAAEINALGGDVDEEETALHISPVPLHGGVFHSYEDHRLATAGAMIGLVVPGIEVENIATTQKTLPDFPGAWAALLSGAK